MKILIKNSGRAIASIVMAAMIIFAVNTPQSAKAQQNQQNQVKGPSAQSIIAKWPAKPKEVAQITIEKFGQPQEATPHMLVWYNNGPWKRTVMHREEVPHAFPKPHTDMLEMFIDYQADPAQYAAIAQYDGSVVLQRTVGEMSARCDKEEMNFLALNLANDIATGKKTTNEARDFYTQTVIAFSKGEQPPYVQKLQFTVPKGGTGDPDKVTIPGASK